MGKNTYKVKDVARLARVTVRTLHHYDAIGLLVPSGRTATGYRLYDEDDLLRLQQILIGRELGLPLEQIRRMLDDPRFDRRQTLLRHREELVRRGRKVERMIDAVDAAIATLKGEKEMEPEEIFDGFDPAEHEREARQRWGSTEAYREAARRTKSYTKDDWVRIKDEHDKLVRGLAARLRGGARATDENVVDLAEQLRLHIDRWYYPCTHGMHAALAAMYVTDERFREAFDRHGEGLAEFVADAIRANADRAR